MQKIIILDTTLRDGEQAPGNSMLAYEKTEMALQLEKLGVDVIEAGFAAASPDDAESVKQIAAIIKNATVCSLSRCKKEDIDIAYEALKGAVKSRLHLFLATSPLHMQYKLELTEQEVLDKIDTSVRYARSLFSEVQFSCEDATRSNRDFLLKAIEVAIGAGAQIIGIPDTVGYSFPEEIKELFQLVSERFPGVVFSAHCHNDLGLAVANTLAAIEGGAKQIDCTVNGIGERAGNTALEEVVLALHTRKDHYDVENGIVLKQISPTSQMLTALTGTKIAANKPIVGKNVFLHESGIHQHGILQHRSTYEILDPSELGIVQNNIVLGKHSGKHALYEYLSSMDIRVSDEELNDLFERFKLLADKKKIVTHKDIMYLISHGHNVKIARLYSLESYSIITVKGSSAVATLKLKTGDEIKIGEGSGDGPLDAAFKTINRIIGKDFMLLDWSSSAITEGEDALGAATLRLEYKGKKVTGRGVSTDTVEASILAYVNACNKILQ